MSPCICIVEKYLRLHFFGLTVGMGVPGHWVEWTPPTHLFVFRCAVLKGKEATQQEAVSGPAGGASLPSQGAGAKESH